MINIREVGFLFNINILEFNSAERTLILRFIIMNDLIEIDSKMIRQWIDQNFDAVQIRIELEQKGFDNNRIESCLREYKKNLRSKRQKTGFIFLSIGAITGFISCVLTLTNLFPDLFHWILYGLTSVAVIVIFIGLYFVFE